MTGIIPELASDGATEPFVAPINLTGFIGPEVKSSHFEFAAKEADIKMWLHADILSSINQRAARVRMFKGSLSAKPKKGSYAGRVEFNQGLLYL